MNAFMKMIAPILLEIFVKVIQSASPALRNAIRDMITKLDEKAATTDNKFDDAAVMLMKIIFAIGKEPESE